MAEQLVLASLVIDPSGVVTGMAQVDRAFVAGERRQQSFSKQTAATAGFMDVLSKRMFSLRSAAVALLGGFTLAGVILQLANLTQNLLTSTDWWKRWADAATDAFNRVIRGETELARVARHVAAATKGTGLGGGIASTFEGVVALQNLIGTLEAERTAIFGTRRVGVGATSITTPQQALAMRQITMQLDNATRALIELQRQSGLTRAEFDKLYGTTTENAIVQAERLEGALDGVAQKLQEVIEKAQRVPEGFGLEAEGLLHPALTGEEFAFPGGARGFGEAGGISEEDLEGVGTKVDSLTNRMRALGEEVFGVNQGFDLLVGAASAFAQAISVGITEGGLTFRSFMADMFQMIGQMLLAWGALGVITSAYGGPPGFPIAFATLAAGVAALAFGASLGKGAAGPAGGQVAAAGTVGGGGRTFNLTLQFVGPTVGFDPNEAGRQLLDMIHRAEGDSR